MAKGVGILRVYLLYLELFVGFKSQDIEFFREIHPLFLRQVTMLLGQLELSHASEFAPIEFAPTLTQLEVKILTFIFLSPNKKDNIVGIMKQNLAKYIYFSFFNSLKVKANSK